MDPLIKAEHAEYLPHLFSEDVYSVTAAFESTKAVPRW